MSYQITDIEKWKLIRHAPFTYDEAIDYFIINTENRLIPIIDQRDQEIIRLKQANQQLMVENAALKNKM